jgi:hypothetical protein
MEEDEQETRGEYSEDNVGEDNIDVEGESSLVSGKSDSKSQPSYKFSKRTEMTEEEKKTVIRELLLSSDEEEEEEERRKRADDLA